MKILVVRFFEILQNIGNIEPKFGQKISIVRKLIKHKNVEENFKKWYYNFNNMHIKVV